MYSDPLAYFLTWHTYGTWLHGDSAGSIDAQHNQYGSDRIGDHPKRLERARDRLKHPPVVLNNKARQAVEDLIAQHCTHRRWRLHAQAVQSNHVHVVVTAAATKPEQVVRQLKQWATRRLREQAMVQNDHKVWADHASTRYLFDEMSLHRAVRYTLESQNRTTDHSRRSIPP
jgi:REP element-mobilizing transposase RayT